MFEGPYHRGWYERPSTVVRVTSFALMNVLVLIPALLWLRLGLRLFEPGMAGEADRPDRIR